MFKVQTLNKISPCGLRNLDPLNYTCSSEIEQPDAILVRSASMHDMQLPDSVKAIARAGAGTNNIPVDACAEKGVVVFNTPGANANAVKELVIAGLLLASRKIVPAIEWAKTLKGNGDEVGKMVEKGSLVGAVTGEVLFGDLEGALLGSMACACNEAYCSSMMLKITTRQRGNEVIILPLIQSKTKCDSASYRRAVKDAFEIVDKIDEIVWAEFDE